MATSCPYDGELSLKADEPQISQKHEDVERNWEYYLIIFPKESGILHKVRRGQMNILVMEQLPVLFSASPDLLTSSITINQPIKQI